MKDEMSIEYNSTTNNKRRIRRYDVSFRLSYEILTQSLLCLYIKQNLA